MNVEQAIRSRRTHKVYGGGAVDRETLEALLESAIWAPNHRYTEPWRFYVVHGAERLQAMNAHVQGALDAMAKDAGEEMARKLRAKKGKMARRLETTAAVVVVSWRRSPDDSALDREDYAATCCAIQNLMLSAHGRGLVSLWSTGKMLMHASLRSFYGVDPGHDVAGVVFLGTPVTPLEGRRRRSSADVTSWV